MTPVVQSALSLVLLAAEGDAAADASWKTLFLKYSTCFSAWGVLFAAASLYLLIPPQSSRGRILGVLCGLVSLVLLAIDLPPLGDTGHQIVFWLTAAVAVGSAGGTIASRNPVYSALWFALSLLGVSGLFIFLEAQFLGVATIVVYAGAIVVTFLFVIMLAQPEGNAVYDRVSWGWFPKPAVALMGAALLALLLSSLTKLDTIATKKVAADRLAAKAQAKEQAKSGSAETVTAAPTNVRPGSVPKQHMSDLGREMFSKQLIAVEVAGTLLLVALVGAVAMAIHGKQRTIASEESAA
jgi:NADH-quinone oxidoreductase subunit J